MCRHIGSGEARKGITKERKRCILKEDIGIPVTLKQRTGLLGDNCHRERAVTESRIITNMHENATVKLVTSYAVLKQMTYSKFSV